MKQPLPQDDILSISSAIKEKIAALEKARNALRLNAIAKADALSKYDRAMTATLIRLKSGVTMEIDGLTVQDPPATIMEKVARGVVWKEKLEADKAVAIYEANTSALRSLMAELNGYQSIFRYLDQMEENK